MITRPIIPIWLMIIICLVLLIISFSKLRIFLLRLLMIVLLFLANLRIMIPNGKAKTIADKIILMKKGEIVWSGNPSNFDEKFLTDVD